MSLSTFFIALGVVSLLAILIRVFWLELLIFLIILRVLFWIGIASTVSAIVWMVFVEDYKEGPIDGFGLTWLFFVIAYSLMAIVAGLIAIDAYGYFKSLIQDLFKK